MADPAAAFADWSAAGDTPCASFVTTDRRFGKSQKTFSCGRDFPERRLQRVRRLRKRGGSRTGSMACATLP